jgi:hypothetical protein
MSEQLTSWRDTATRKAIVDFVERVTAEGGPDFVPPSERIAVYDNDGTLWCEKPMPIELGFVLMRLAEMAEADESLREKQPWKAARETDYAWLADGITKHYHGDDSDVRVLLGGMIQAFAGQSVEHYSGAADAFLRGGKHPTLGRAFHECGYLPMIELLGYLEEIYGIPSERVIGSSNALEYIDDEHGGTVSYLATPDVFDDGPTKPVRIWSRIGKRPILAAGNSNGDVPMLRYAGGKGRPALRLLLLHDDEEREFAYTSGAEKSLELAAAHDWTVVSVKNDWDVVFADV